MPLQQMRSCAAQCNRQLGVAPDTTLKLDTAGLLPSKFDKGHDWWGRVSRISVSVQGLR